MHLRPNLASASFLILIAACSGGGGNGSTDALPTPSPFVGTSVTVTFLGVLPSAVAVSTANGLFSASKLSGNTLALRVPAGTNAYAIAVACPAASALVAEYVYEANLSDGTSYSVRPCSAPAAATGPAIGSFDVSAISGAVSARIIGAQGYSGDVNASTGAFNVSMPAGTNDVALLALDGGGNVLAVKMLRSQQVPGSINAGATIVATAADAVTNQTVTVAGVPAGFRTPPTLSAVYVTANGTVVPLTSASPSQYPALSPADLSAVDQYRIDTNASSAAINETIGMTSYAITATALTLHYPSVWAYTPPAAAQFPTFSFIYSGFRGLAAQTYRSQIAWQPAGGSSVDQLTVFATAAYVGMQTSIAIPNLTALPGFFGSAASGATVNWSSEIDGGTFQSYIAPPPAPGALSYVQARGTYVEP